MNMAFRIWSEHKLDKRMVKIRTKPADTSYETIPTVVFTMNWTLDDILGNLLRRRREMTPNGLKRQLEDAG